MRNESACWLSKGRACSARDQMTRDQIQTAIRERISFVIKMADGEKYEVPDRDRVALGQTTVIVVGDDDMPHVLPLLTMTGISYLKKK